MKNFYKKILRGEEGQDLAEYALLFAFLFALSIATLNNMAATVNDMFSNTSGTLST